MRLLHRGKVRDVYALADEGGGDDLLLVASDRISVYDVVLPTPIPDKGAVLTRLSRWWFDRLADLVPNHLVDGAVPAELAGRAMRCRRLDMLPVECVARGYLTGGGLAEYAADGTVSGVALPPGLVDGSRLPEPVFTPSSKAPQGEHDAPMTYAQVEALVGADTAARLRELTLAVYRRGAETAAAGGILVADTKLEFGRDPATGEVVLADEVLTPDSSRFWPADRWAPGRPQRSFDKQFVRDWSATLPWDRTAPGPAIPPDVVAATRARYIQAYERITGTRWT
ncbi:MAG TPA: phosphoribosylaminoimidazolesuccinocarboxamide synthase [Pseudonocardia sp.]